jgi:hypothetical protein
MRSRLGTRIFSAVLACALAITGLAACTDMYGYTNTGTSQSSSVGMTVQVERGSKQLDIKRPKPGAKAPSKLEKGSWTVLVYLCGSDLESQNGAATKDLAEMVGASGNDNVRFIVQTGGAKQWATRGINARQLGRYLVQNGSIVEVGTLNAASMGNPSTLSDFITWGVSNYPAEHMALILWDHGGGSITGVCFDERNNYDSLSVRELDTAMGTAFTKMWDKFDFVGFDACLMSTLETANVMASYADYMVASQESEPGNGWEYSSIVEYLSKNPSAATSELGKTICNSYLASLDRNSKGFATLSVVDLSKVDDLIQSFYRFSQEMYDSGSNQSNLAAMSRGIRSVDNFGSNNWLEGFTNMVDLGGLVQACASTTPSAQETLDALNAAVTYQVRGTYHASCSGLSTYYPLKVSDSSELVTFQSVAPNPSYLAYVDRLAHGATFNGGSQYTNYSDQQWYEGGLWSVLMENTGTPEAEAAQQEAEEYWNYVDDHADSSQVITFAEEPQVNEDGIYWFQLDEHGLENAAVVSALVYEASENGKDLIALGETYDIYGDWDTGKFEDGFEGEWLSLPDGQNLCTYVVDSGDDYVIYTSPITLNGKDTFLRMRQNLDDGTVTVEGAWDGIGENGAVDRSATPLQSGDVIIPRYDSFTVDGTQGETYEGNEYKLDGKTLQVAYDYLPDGVYLYDFCVEDVFGDVLVTSAIQLEIEEDGSIFFVQ